MNHINVTQKNLLKVPDGKYRVSNNLYLVVRRDGRSRSFVFRYRSPSGVRKDLSLGSATVVSLASAKEEAMKCQVLLARGVDPYDVRQKNRKFQEEKENAARSQQTFSKFSKYALAEIIKNKNYRKNTKRMYVNQTNSYLINVFGNLKLSEITPKLIAQKIKNDYEKSPVHGRYRIAILKKLLDIAVREELIDQNPAIWKNGVDNFLTKVNNKQLIKHFRSATVEETSYAIRKFIEKGTVNYFVLAFIILTACRTHEVCNLSWEHVDLEKEIMIIPQKFRKDKMIEDHRVPLSEQAVELLKRRPERTGLVFKGAIHSKVIISSSLLYCLRRVLPNNTPTIHGFRSTFRDWAAENGIDFILAEKSLMHVVGNGVTQAYQRSDLLEQRRPVMQKWADTLISVEEVKKLLAE